MDFRFLNPQGDLEAGEVSFAHSLDHAMYGYPCARNLRLVLKLNAVLTDHAGRFGKISEELGSFMETSEDLLKYGVEQRGRRTVVVVVVVVRTWNVGKTFIGEDSHHVVRTRPGRAPLH